MPDWIVQLIIPLIKAFITRISPEIQKSLHDFAHQLFQQAEKTPNPLDNILVGILFAILGIPTPQ